MVEPRKVVVGVTVELCPNCRWVMRLRHGPFGWFLACTNHDCTTIVDALVDGTPCGVPSRQVERTACKRAHTAFDLLWRGDLATIDRRTAYRLLSKHLGLPEEECHIKQFDVARCEAVVQWALGLLTASSQLWVERDRAEEAKSA